MTSPADPSPARIADCLKVAELGGDLGRLALVCTHQADRYQGEQQARLLATASAMRWAAALLEELEALEEGDGDAA
jgi:hypothetical protein